MKILVINAGSSSLKYQLIDMDTEEMIAKGNCERIGIEGSFIGHKTADGRYYNEEVDMPDHSKAFKVVAQALLDKEHGVIENLDEVTAIGHRVVQGGALFSAPEIVNESVIKGIESLIPLAPLHNKGHVQAIRGCLDVFGEKVPEVVVFDTAFHATMPRKAYMYAVPYEYYENDAVRRYGAHGTSHKFVAHAMADLLNKDISDLKLITCHIGNGSSITAVKNGKVIDTSMGLTPLDGIMMGTRSGCLDPSVVTFIAGKYNISPADMSELLNKKSGLLGISGVSSDDRDVTKAELEGNDRAALAHEMLYYQIAKYIGQYYVALGGCDGIVFTAGLGENQPVLRQSVCDYLDFIGVKLDAELNSETKGCTKILSTDDSTIPVAVIATNEELAIARETKALVE